MAFPPGFLDELRARIPLGSLVGRQVRLIRKASGQCSIGDREPFSQQSQGAAT